MVWSRSTSEKRVAFGLRVILLTLLLVKFVSQCAAITETRTVKLAWAPSSGARGYAIYYGTSSSLLTTRLDVTTNTATAIDGLMPGGGYVFEVVAYDSTGVESAPSNQISIIAPVQLHMQVGKNPAAPVSLQFTAIPGRYYEVQGSPDMRRWTTLWQSGVMTTNGVLTYQDSPAGGPYPKRYYRLAFH